LLAKGLHLLFRSRKHRVARSFVPSPRLFFVRGCSTYTLILLLQRCETTAESISSRCRELPLTPLSTRTTSFTARTYLQYNPIQGRTPLRSLSSKLFIAHDAYPADQHYDPAKERQRGLRYSPRLNHLSHYLGRRLWRVRSLCRSWNA
jgi:hypothetical protein